MRWVVAASLLLGVPPQETATGDSATVSSMSGDLRVWRDDATLWVDDWFVVELPPVQDQKK